MARGAFDHGWLPVVFLIAFLVGAAISNSQNHADNCSAGHHALAELDLARAKPLKRHQARRAAAEPDMFREAGE